VTFVDETTLEVQAGRGGDGSAAMRREKYRPLGGPAGGDGGDGGDVVFVVDERLTTLLDLKHRRVLRAKRGENGRGKDQYGKAGESLEVRMPIGTQVFDAQSEELLADLNTAGQRFVVAKGGRGGRGNIHFVTPEERAPMVAEEGRPGERRSIRLELKLLADVGIIGFPNVGKSTLISVVSRARPKIADYPFTTLIPNLGVVRRNDFKSFVIADIPGIIPGAATGAGLGLRFLKHVERTRVLLILVSFDAAPGRSMISDYEVLREEVANYDQQLAQRPSIVAVSKSDLTEVQEALPEFQSAMRERGDAPLVFSSVSHQGVDALLNALERLLDQNPLPLSKPSKKYPTAADSPHRQPDPNDE
jgi:GTP-binding protein